MAVGFELNNIYGRSVIGDDGVLPRFIGKYSLTYLSHTASKMGGEGSVTVTNCLKEPLVYVYINGDFAGHVSHIVDLGSSEWKIHMAFPYESSSLTTSDITLYVFSDGYTTHATTGYGIVVKKANGEVSFDSTETHLKPEFSEFFITQAWLLISDGNSNQWNTSTKVYNTTRNEFVYIEFIPLGDTIVVDFAKSYDIYNDFVAWQNGDNLSTTAAGSTLAKVNYQAELPAWQSQYEPLRNSSGVIETWADRGISKPALLSTQKGGQFTSYYYYGSGYSWGIYLYYSMNSIKTVSTGVEFGLYPVQSEATGTNQENYDGSSISMMTFGVTPTTHGGTGYGDAFCVGGYCGQVSCMNAMVTNFFGNNTLINWGVREFANNLSAIDGADYD